jgi:hypothetical protein
MIYSIKSDRGLRPAMVLWDSQAYGVDRPARKFELTPELMRDGSVIDQHDCLLLGEGHCGLSWRVTLGLLALDHVVLHHGTIFELVPDRVRMVWAGHLEKILKVISRLPRLVAEIMLGGSDVLLVRVIGLLVIVIIIATGSNCDPLRVPRCPLPITFRACLRTFVGSLG